MYRALDFKRDKIDIPGTVETIEYDPTGPLSSPSSGNRDGERRYILTPLNIKVGQIIISSDSQVDILPGTRCLCVSSLWGRSSTISSSRKNKGGQVAKAAGSGAQILAKEGDYAQVRLPSSEIRKIHQDCGDGRSGQQPGPPEHLDRQGGTDPLARLAPPCPRHGHEPHRPPARRRRRAVQGRPPSGQSRRDPHQGIQDEAETSGRRCSSSGEGVNSHEPLSQERPVHRFPPPEKVLAMRSGQGKKGDQDLVPPLDHHPGDGRRHDSRA